MTRRQLTTLLPEFRDRPLVHGPPIPHPIYPSGPVLQENHRSEGREYPQHVEIPAVKSQHMHERRVLISIGDQRADKVAAKMAGVLHYYPSPAADVVNALRPFIAGWREEGENHDAPATPCSCTCGCGKPTIWEPPFATSTTCAMCPTQCGGRVFA